MIFPRIYFALSALDLNNLLFFPNILLAVRLIWSSCRSLAGNDHFYIRPWSTSAITHITSLRFNCLSCLRPLVSSSGWNMVVDHMKNIVCLKILCIFKNVFWKPSKLSNCVQLQDSFQFVIVIWRGAFFQRNNCQLWRENMVEAIVVSSSSRHLHVHIFCAGQYS